MQEVEVTWQRAVRIWWSWAWRTTLLSVATSLILGLSIGFFAGLLGFEQVKPVVKIVCTGAGFLIGILMMVRALKKPYPGFRIALIAQDKP